MSTVRSTRLYSICSATKGDQPRRSASVCICATAHRRIADAEIEDFPGPNEVVGARMTSSGRVVMSHAWR